MPSNDSGVAGTNRIFLLITMALIATAWAPNVGADEFEAMPGLWKTTLRSWPAEKDPTHVQWRCVDEGADPWVAFARLPVMPHEICTRKGFVRTDTSLKWRLDCTGDVNVSNHGFLVFDGAKHYSGKVRLTGTVVGYPVEQEIRVEGTRRAACTSPQD
jgi:hypothetical protein